MPEFVMPLADKAQIKSFAELDEFTQGYVEALFFTECHGDNPELEEKTFGDLAPETLEAIVKDCAAFQEAAKALLESVNGVRGKYERADYDMERAGNDFWYTRNGHGTGFWDRGLGEPGDQLAEMARRAGSRDVYAGDDGRVYLS